MNICFVINNLEPAGAQTILLDLVRNSKDSGTSFTVCYFGGDATLAEPISEAGAEVIPLRSRGKFDVVAMFRLFEVFRRREFDLVHAHLPYSQTIARVMARLAGVPVVISTQHSFPENYHPLTRIVERYTRWLDDVTIGNSEAVKEAFDRGSPRVEWDVIYNGVDIEQFSESLDLADVDAGRRRIGVGDGPLFLSVGRYEPVKAQSYLIEAMNEVVATCPTARLILVGWGSLEDELKNQATELGISENVVFTGQVPKEEMPLYYRVADAFVLASESEGFGLSMVEAMAAGLPVVATDIPGIREVVGTDGDGILVPPADSGAFAEAMVAIIEKSNLGDSEWARKRARRFDITTTFDNHLTLYRSLVK